MLWRYALVLCLVIWSQAQAGEHGAVLANTADVASTAVGLSMGAAEANPLGLGLLVVKLATYQKIKALPPEEQPPHWGMFAALGWGATANNLCVIASGGACLLVGLVAGVVHWHTTEDARLKAQFEALCAKARAAQPDMVCAWKIKEPT